MSSSVVAVHPRKWWTGMAASAGLIVAGIAADPLPLAIRLAFGGLGGYGVAAGMVLALTQRQPFSCRKVVLLSLGASAATALFYKMSDFVPHKKAEPPFALLFACVGSLAGSLTIAFSDNLYRWACTSRSQNGAANA